MKNKNNLFLTLILSLAALQLPAQNTEWFVVGSAGQSTQAQDLQLSFTVGEPVVGNLNAENILIAQGFQRLLIDEITTGIELPDFVNKITAYPNPAENMILLDIPGTVAYEFFPVIYDLTGRKQILPLAAESASGISKFKIDITRLRAGLYHLVIKTKNGSPVRVFKIQKL